MGIEPRSLEAVGVGEIEERLYRRLLVARGSSSEELASTSVLSLPRVRHALSSLQTKGLITRSPGAPPRYYAVAPDIAVDALILDRQRDLEGVRAIAAQLTDDFRQGARDESGQVVELLIGPDAIRQRFVQLQHGAEQEVVSFDKPPYVTPPGGNLTETEALRRGVRYRAIYDKESLAVAGQLDAIRLATAAGEQARVMAGLPMKLYMADRRSALLPLHVSNPADSALLVHPSALLDALLLLFELLWARASEISFFVAGEVTVGDRATDARLLTLLVAGLKDDAMARELGVSRRTVQRRLRREMERRGVRSRQELLLDATRLDKTAPI